MCKGGARRGEAGKGAAAKQMFALWGNMPYNRKNSAPERGGRRAARAAELRSREETNMLLHILAVGDVVGEGGQDILSRRLREIQEREDIHFTVVNGENASGVGITPRRPGASWRPGRT